MEKKPTKRPPIGGVDYDYKIGNFIDIHSNINDPDRWYLRCEKLGVLGLPICHKTCDEFEIAQRVKILLRGGLSDIYKLISDLEVL